MSNCIYCGKSAGLFRKKHPECCRVYEEGKQRILALASSFASTPSPLESLSDHIASIGKASFIPESEQRQIILKGWKKALEDALNEGVLNEEQEKRLNDAAIAFSISQAELANDVDGSYTRIVKSVIIRDVLKGIIPNHFKIEGNIPFNLQKGETIVWAFTNCEYYEDQTRRKYIGRTQGIGIRIMKGMYYRTGGFEGHSIARTERAHVDTGLVAITNKHIYFAGELKSFRVPYAKIVSFEPFSDGIGIVRDAATAKPQIFVTHDGWFTYNLV